MLTLGFDLFGRADETTDFRQQRGVASLFGVKHDIELLRCLQASTEVGDGFECWSFVSSFFLGGGGEIQPLVMPQPYPIAVFRPYAQDIAHNVDFELVKVAVDAGAE